MNYNEYIKDKLISLYFKNEKVGFSLTNKNTFLLVKENHMIILYQML